MQLLEGAWFLASLSVFSDNKNNFHVLTKILLKVAKPGYPEKTLNLSDTLYYTIDRTGTRRKPPTCLTLCSILLIAR
jgi:hypothetical protein